MISIETKRSLVRVGAILIALFIGIVLCYIGMQTYFDFPCKAKFLHIGIFLCTSFLIYIARYIFIYLAKHGLFKGGFKYFCRHKRLMKSIKTQLLDDKVYIER